MHSKLMVRHKPIELNNYNKIYDNNKITKITSNKCIAVYDNAEFTSELTYVLSKNNKTKKSLIIDADALSPSVAFTLGLRKTVNGNVLSKIDTLSSFNVALDCINKGNISSELLSKICVQFKPNMYVLTGNDDINNYEYYNTKSFEKLLNIAKKVFDVVIINTNGNIYDEFLVRTFLFSDVILVPCIANLINIRKLNSYLTLLAKKQNINLNKSKFVSFNYNKNIHVSPLTMNNITQGNFLGVINYDKRRIKYRNHINSCYCTRISKNIEKQYLLLIKSIQANR